MEEGYVLYFPEQTDPLFFRHALSTVMMVSESVKNEYGKWAERIVFRGDLAGEIFRNFTEKKYNLNASFIHEQSMYDEIVLELERNVKIKKGDVIRSIGFEYKIEREVKPQISITIIKSF